MGTVTSLVTSSSSSAISIEPTKILGSIEPRIFTPPLRKLKPAVIDEEGNILEPATTYGFAVIDFAYALGTPLDPWEEVAVIRGGELLPNGKPRFRKLLIMVARQNGKTFLLDILVKFWLYVERRTGILVTSKNRGKAQEFWEGVMTSTERHPDLRAYYGGRRKSNGAEFYETTDGCMFKFAAPNGDAGRGDSNERIVMDEIRQQHNWDCWASAYPSMNAKPFGQLIAITNQGDDKGVVLDSLHKSAMDFIKTGKGDPKLGLLEWSAPAGSSPLDPHALAMANPNLNRRVDLEDLLSEGERVLKAGGDELNVHLTEVLCIRIRSFDGAVDPDAYERCCIGQGLESFPSGRIAFFLDMAWGNRHVALVAAAVSNTGQVHVEPVNAWDGRGAPRDMMRDLSGHLERSGVRRLGWMPNSPMAALAPELRKLKLPRGVVMDEIKGEVSEVCMSFSEMVDAEQLVVYPDEAMTEQVISTTKKYRNNTWVFFPPENGYCDFTYAAAGAVWLARTMPTPIGKPRVILPRQK